jgi:hypothetical protein
MTMYEKTCFKSVGAKEAMYIAILQIEPSCTQYCVQLGYDISLFAR